jgi:hypothetical protein
VIDQQRLVLCRHDEPHLRALEVVVFDKKASYFPRKK